MTMHKLVIIIKRSSDHDLVRDGGEEFLLSKMIPPPMPEGEEYRNYFDSDLWDLPSAPLKLLEGENDSSVVVQKHDDPSFGKVDLKKFDVESALKQALLQFGLSTQSSECWEFWKYVEDAEFGPGPLVHIVFIVGKLKFGDVNLQGFGRWISIPCTLKWFSAVKPNNDRLGPFVAMGLLADSKTKSTKWEVPSGLHFQDFPPGVTLVPMKSRTAKPFWTTNLVVVAPKEVRNNLEDSRFTACGDSLVMDPGCCSDVNSQLEHIIDGLPRKLIVFVTHHHSDHIDGLSVVQKCNPDAILLAHINTMTRIGKDKWPLRFVSVSGGEKINIGGQLMEAIYSAGHTDGHMALLHMDTNSLVVGDHCVGQGSSLLDITSGGNMKDYFQTTYKYLDLSPHFIIPMHGRLNLWPKQMLCGYLKHRRDRELSILKAIESGAETLFDIISVSYANVDTKLWIHVSSNVRIHVEHLAYQEKLPKEFSLEKFQASCRLHLFLYHWGRRYLKRGISFSGQKSTFPLFVAIALAFAGLALSYSLRSSDENIYIAQWSYDHLYGKSLY